jgi:hypothetical protein
VQPLEISEYRFDCEPRSRRWDRRKESIIEFGHDEQDNKTDLILHPYNPDNLVFLLFSFSFLLLRVLWDLRVRIASVPQRPSTSPRRTTDSADLRSITRMEILFAYFTPLKSISTFFPLFQKLISESAVSSSPVDRYTSFIVNLIFAKLIGLSSSPAYPFFCALDKSETKRWQVSMFIFTGGYSYVKVSSRTAHLQNLEHRL